MPVLIFLIPTQLAFHFWPDFSHVFGIRVDYLSPAIYLTDLLFFLLLLFYLKENRFKISRNTLWWGIFAFLFATVNGLSSQGKWLALVKWTKVFELVALVLVVKDDRVVTRGWVTTLSLSVIFFSLIAIVQFLLQRTIGGPFYWLGERTFTSSTPGIALFSFLGQEFLRPYSTFGHPNALAGYLGVSLVLISSYQLKTQSQNLVKYTSLILALVVILLSASSGAILSLIIILLMGKSFLKSSSLLLFLLVLLSFLLPVFSSYFLEKGLDLHESVETRLVLSEAAGRIVSYNPLFGVGLGSFIPTLPGRWLQPVHNIYLLILAEAGMIGLLLFSIVILKSLSASVQRGRLGLIACLVFILLTGALDHYWVTLQQNQLLLCLILGLSFRKKLVSRQ